MVEKKGFIKRKGILVLSTLIILGILGLGFVLAWEARAELAAGAGRVNITSLVRYGNYSTTINVTVMTTLINHSANADSNFNVTLYCNKSGGPMSSTTGADLVKVVTLYNGTNGNTSAGTGYAILSNRSVWINNLFTPAVENTLMHINCSLYAENTTSWAWSHGTVSAAGKYISMNLSNLTFDSTPPSVNFSGITEAVNNGNYTGIISFNVTVLDQRMGVESVYFNITNSTGSQLNWTKAVAQSSASYYNLTVDTTGFPDGKYNVTVWANDTQLNNMNSTEYLAIILDKTVPTGSLSCTPNSVHTEDTVTCTCTATDATSGVKTKVYTVTPSTANTGTFSQTCVITDESGNSFTASTTYTVESSASVTPSSSSSTTTTTTTNTTALEKPIGLTHSWTEIVPATPVTLSSFAVGTGVTQIEIEVSSAAQNVKITVNKYEDKPANVSVSKSDAYKYLHIETTNLDNKLSKATMKVQVEKTWITENELTQDEIAIFKFDEVANEWNELPTTFDSEDSLYYYYTIELNSFSYFAIASKVVEETGISQSTLLWIIAGVIGLAVIIGGGIALRKRKKK